MSERLAIILALPLTVTAAASLDSSFELSRKLSRKLSQPRRWLRLLSLPTLALLTLFTSGCDYHLRGYTPMAMNQGHAVDLAVELPSTASVDALKRPLYSQLIIQGFRDNAQADTRLSVQKVQLARQQLSGKLTLISLVLTADVQMMSADGKPITPPVHVIARRQYQYDIATVNTDNPQEALLTAELYQEIAYQLANLASRSLTAAQPVPAHS